MPEHIRALIILITISVMVFFYQKKAIAPMLLPEEFTRWRNAWFAITLLAFLSHNFWLFIILSAAYLLYIAKSEDNKFALYFILLLAVPTIYARIPVLFDISFNRLLALTILLPFFISFRPSQRSPSFGKSTAEKLMFGFIILNTLLALRTRTFTDTMRYGIYGFTEVFLPYYAASRAIKDFEQLKKVMIALVVACLVIGAIGIFEYGKLWLLYNPLNTVFKVDWDMGTYLVRGDSIRALASLGHSIVLGYVMVIGLGFYLFIAPSISSITLRLIGYGLIIGGLIGSLSRGPWLGAVVLFLVFIAYGKKAIRRLSLCAIAIIFAIPILNLIPGGEKVINLIPFVGETDKANVEYREKLIDRSILIVKRNPFFGVPDSRSEPEMADMVQGQGIVDIVNSYIGVATGNGLVGLSMFLGFFALTLLKINKSISKIKDKNSEEHLCGRSLFATMVAVLVIIFTVSGIGIIPTMYWSLAGLIVSYARVTNMIKSTDKVDLTIEKTMYPTTRLKSEM